MESSIKSTGSAAMIIVILKDKIPVFPHRVLQCLFNSEHRTQNKACSIIQTLTIMKSSFIFTSAVCAAIPWLTHALTPGPEFVRINKTDAVRASLPPKSHSLSRSAGGHCSRPSSGPVSRRKYNIHIATTIRSFI